MPDIPLKRIVIAEDDPAIGTMLRKVLSQFYDVVMTHDGAAALAAAGKQPPPDLLLLDVMMPGMDGHAVAAEEVVFGGFLFAEGEEDAGADE